MQGNYDHRHTDRRHRGIFVACTTHDSAYPDIYNTLWYIKETQIMHVKALSISNRKGIRNNRMRLSTSEISAAGR